MGRSGSERLSAPGGNGRRRRISVFSGLWLRFQFRSFRAIAFRSGAFSLLALFSALFLIYCSTSSPLLHEQKPEPVEAASASPAQAAVVSKSPENKIPGDDRPLADLSPLLKLKGMDYNPGVLRGVFWREKDFDGRYFLTFDDGPNRAPSSDAAGQNVCESILDSLAVYGYKAVFFINGKNLAYGDEAEKRELRGLLLRIIGEGHLLGNHSYSHHNLARGIFVDGEHDREDVENELLRTQAVLDEVLGFSYPLLLVRPPYAEPGRTDILDGILSRNGHFLVSLQFDSYDYAYKEDGRWNGPTIGARIMSLMEEQPEGGVLLLHELDSTARMLPGLLENIQGRQMPVGRLEDHLYKKYGRET